MICAPDEETECQNRENNAQRRQSETVETNSVAVEIRIDLGIRVCFGYGPDGSLAAAGLGDANRFLGRKVRQRMRGLKHRHER